FEATWKLLIVGNHKPRVANDQAVWRRLRLIPFDVSFEGREDEKLPQKLRAERERILLWMVEGCKEWQATGLNDPPAVLTATADYRRDSDTLGRFLSECCVRGAGYSMRARRAFEAFTDWAEDSGEYHWKEALFGRRMKE